MGKWRFGVAENIIQNEESGVFYVRAKVNGKPQSRSLKTKSLRIAKSRRAEALREMRAAHQSKDESDMPKRASEALKKALEMTLDYYRAKPSYQLKPSSLEYRRNMCDMIAQTAPKGTPSRWTPSQMREWWGCVEITRYSANRKNNCLGTMRQMFALLEEAGHVAGDPTKGLEKAKIKRKEKVLPSRDDFKILIESIRGQKKRHSLQSSMMAEFMAYSGFRLGEAQRVNKADILKNHIIARETKNGDERRVPIVPAMRELLKVLQQEPFGAGGDLFSIKSPREALKAACLREGVTVINNHGLRHLFATSCIESGVDIPTVAGWLGHKDRGVLAMKTYGHLRDEHSLSQAAKVSF